MKKKMIALLAGALMMLSAASAFAFTSANVELYRVIYDGTSSSTFETMTDLGSLSSLTAKAPGTLLDSATSAFTSVAGYSAADVGSNLHIAYFAVNASTSDPTYANKSAWLSQTGETVAPVTGPGKFGTAGAPLKTIVTTVYASNTAGVNTKDASGMTSTLTTGSANTNSFKYKGFANSTFNGYLQAGGSFAMPSLSTLAATDVTHIYFFNGTADSTGSTGTLFLSLTTDVLHGTTSIGPANTPIPAAIYLMGSGLLGLVGLRRKQRG